MTQYDSKMKARALADRMGGAAPLAMICLDPQVGASCVGERELGLRIWPGPHRQEGQLSKTPLIRCQECPGRISLRRALEEVLEGLSTG